MIINCLGFATRSKKNLVTSVATSALENLGLNNIELSIKFVSKHEIRRLNKQFRQIDRVTDVLSFPLLEIAAGEMPEQAGEEPTYLGDMALCVARAKRQCKDYDTTLDAELKKLVIHSILHLLGYDHIKDADFAVMQQKEAELDGKIKI
jgi:probable rRNA maturation factor